MNTLLEHLLRSKDCTCELCKLSDKNCESYCNLKQGSDFEFLCKLRSQASRRGKRHIRKIMKSKEGKKIFDENRKRTRKEYPKVYSQKQGSLIAFPPFFTFDSRIKETTTFSEQDLERRVKEGDVKDEDELTFIQKLLKTASPQLGEGHILSAVLHKFYHHSGFLINGYEPNSYLKVFVEMAKQLRNQQKSSPASFVLTDLENDILDAMNIDVSKMNQEISSWVAELKGKTNISGGGSKLLANQAVEDAQRQKDCLKKCSGMFENNREYTVAEVTSLLTLVVYDDVVNEAMKKRYNKKPGQGTFAFTSSEINVLSAMGVQELSIQKEVDDWIHEILKQTSAPKVKGDEVKGVLEKSQIGSSSVLEIAKGKFKAKQEFTIEQVRKMLTMCYFEEVLERAKQVSRKQSLLLWPGFDGLDLDILAAVGLQASEINSQVSSWMQNVKSIGSTIPGSTIKTSLDTYFKIPKDILQKTKGKFKTNQTYSDTEILNTLTMVNYEETVRPPGEFDLLLTLGDSSMSINIEVKRQLNPDKQRKENLNDSLRSAAKQMSKHALHQANIFGSMISENHQFIKCAAILPGHLDEPKICPHCKDLIIRGDTMEEIERQVQKLCDRLTKIVNPFVDRQTSQEDFLNLFEAMVGFSHVSTKQKVVSNAWAQIQGTNHASYLSAGWTEATTDLTEDELRAENVLDRPHDCYKFIYFYGGQIALLYNRPKFVLFTTDYGGGKFMTNTCTTHKKNLITTKK